MPGIVLIGLAGAGVTALAAVSATNTVEVLVRAKTAWWVNGAPSHPQSTLRQAGNRADKVLSTFAACPLSALDPYTIVK